MKHMLSLVLLTLSFSASATRYPRYFHCLGQDSDRNYFEIKGEGDETGAISKIKFIDRRNPKAPTPVLKSGYVSYTMLAFSLGNYPLMGGEVILEATPVPVGSAPVGASPQPSYPSTAATNDLRGSLFVKGVQSDITVNCVVALNQE